MSYPTRTAWRARFGDLFSGTERFTPRTRLCLERGLGNALLGRRGDGLVLRRAVERATRELLVQGLDAPDIMTMLASVVADAGRACRADRTALVSGEPTWMMVRHRVLGAAQDELARCGCQLSATA
jgi:hypothetical protein